MLRDCAIDRPSDVFLFILFQVWIVYARDERTVYGNLLTCIIFWDVDLRFLCHALSIDCRRLHICIYDCSSLESGY